MKFLVVLLCVGAALALEESLLERINDINKGKVLFFFQHFQFLS